MAAITGFGQFETLDMPGLAACAAPCPWDRSRCVISTRSAPAQNARPPAPISTATSASSSFVHASKAS